MLFLISLAAAVLFTVLCGDVLKKHPLPFYVSFTAAAVFFAVFPFKNAPNIVSDYFIALFSKGALAAAFFVIVMFAGAFKAGSRGAKKLMPIRAELAIAASLLTITHLISYGFLYTKRLITGSISPTQATVTYFAIPLVILLIPLAVTSFKKIRKKMNPKKWKKLQRFAYLFYVLLYVLLYVHILIAYMPSARHGKVKSVINVIVYSAVFLLYAAMRISKALAKQHKESEKKIRASLSAASAAVFAVVSIIAAMPAVQAIKASEVKAEEPVAASVHTSSETTFSSEAAPESKTNVSSKTNDVLQSSSVSETSSLSVKSESSKINNSISSSSKSNTGKTINNSSAALSSSEYENTVTEREETANNREEQQDNETESPKEASSEQIEEESMVNSEESVPEAASEPEPDPEVIKVFNDGEYTAKCYEEDEDVRVMITVRIVIENDKIVDIKVDSDEADTWYLDSVLDNVVP